MLPYFNPSGSSLLRPPTGATLFYYAALGNDTEVVPLLLERQGTAGLNDFPLKASREAGEEMVTPLTNAQLI